MAVPNSKPRSAVGLGITTLVTIMVVVLLTTFSVLALVSARSDLKLSTMAQESARQYYAANAAAERWLAEQDSAPLPPGDQEPQPISQSFAIDDNRQLQVTILRNADGTITIQQWQTVATSSEP